MAKLPTLSISPEKSLLYRRQSPSIRPRRMVSPTRIRAPMRAMTACVPCWRTEKDDPVLTELTSFIHDLNDDEQIDLVALVWLGRGDGDIENWGELRAECGARAQQAGPPPICWKADAG